MEEIIKKIIEIDNKAKAISAEEKNRNANIEEFIEDEYIKEKKLLDKQYEEEIKKQVQKYEAIFDEKKIEIDNEISKKIFQINERFKMDKEMIIKQIVSDIKEGENND